jgi:5'-3' exonuclease
MFTPGTGFMNKLSCFMKQQFLKKEDKYGVREIIVATPDEPGEGEHKLYTHLRENPTDKPCAIYGLDADLMMLSLFHLSYCANMYIFREAPQFAQSLLKTITSEKEEPIFIDVAKLSRSISHEMRCSDPDPHRMYDYVFLCFFLGNDFLPHFPSLNIRTSGITSLLDTYRANMGKKKECFLLSKTNPPQIQWREVARLISELAKNEKNYICQEYAIRKKWDKTPPQIQPKQTVKMRIDLFQNTPVLYRKEEHFIDPHEKGWEERYYKILFGESQVNEICKNYLEGLEWVYNYYLLGKVDWEWKYNYHYPPLLRDLVSKIPLHPTTFLHDKKTCPVSAQAQLAYVLPPVYHHLLPDGFTEKYKNYYDGYTLNHDGLPILEFQWAFCRYFWESHIHLPPIPLDILKQWSEF